jgi:hypothetical protein
MPPTQSPPQTRFEDLTLREKTELIRAISFYPALTIMVFLRRKLGYRTLKPTWLIIVTIMLFVAAVLAPKTATGPFVDGLTYFALLMLGIGIFQRWRRWKAIVKGVRWHSHSTGIPWLGYLPLPGFFYRYSRINRFLDPLISLVVGAVLGMLVSRLLGAWIMLSALFLYIFEDTVYNKQLERDLDTLDGLIYAEVQQETAEHFAGAQPSEKQRRLEETAGIATGLSPDIQKQIEARRKKVEKAADNLAGDA